jgi:DHA2 family multidrug resistance protein
LADAAGLNSFVRQIGGSVGLTIFATLLGRFASQAKASVGWHVSLLRPEVASHVGAMVRQMTAKVADPNLAYALVVKTLSAKAALQGMVLSFEKSFLLQALAFVAVLPLLFFLRVKRTDSDGSTSSEPAPHIEISME